MPEIFKFRNNRKKNLMSQNIFEISEFKNSAHNGTESISYLDTKVWELVPDNPEKNYFIDQFQGKNKEMEPRKLLVQIMRNLHSTYFLSGSSKIFVFAYITSIAFKLFHDGDRYHIETTPLICSANPWTGFYMITASVMKELNFKSLSFSFCF